MNKNRNTIHAKTVLSPGGSTIIEYHYSDQHEQQLHEEQLLEEQAHKTQQKTILSSSINNFNNNNNNQNVQSSSNTNDTASIAAISPVPHQHYHKKYLREHDKSLKQNINSQFATPAKQQFAPNNNNNNNRYQCIIHMKS